MTPGPPPSIRPEHHGDEPSIRALHLAAFPSPDEADLVDALRAAHLVSISLVACLDQRIVGHILFSPVRLEPGPVGLGLAPVAVLPTHQRRGIGAALIHAGLQRCRELHAPFIVVLGDPAYYRRFGFLPALSRNLRCRFPPPEAFQFIELIPGSIPAGALAHYAAPFNAFESP